MRIIGGLILITIGTLIVIKSENLFQALGRIAWFEKNFGSEGGSRLGYKLIGLVVIFFGLLMASGTFDGFIKTALSPLTKTR
ncbi:MAG: hypothetical protein PHP37_02310 [Patescibacteria group bacterium]|nr:hypothetical protein [Patescibacteria group bacterium]